MWKLCLPTIFKVCVCVCTRGGGGGWELVYRSVYDYLKHNLGDGDSLH